ncbi:Mur ligase family protein, partial [Amylibacter sp.]|nr:Mur ligase family protein [Amylibacter sp.]
VPLTLARMPKETDFAVIEIGMNNPDEIRPLAKLAKLDVAIVLNVAPVHLKAFKNIEGIAYAKAEIFENLSSSNTAIVNSDLSTFDILLNTVQKVRSKLITFGHSDAADYKLISSLRYGNKTSVTAKMNNLDFNFYFGDEGDLFAINAMSVFAAAEAVGIERKNIGNAFSTWQAPCGRGKRSTIRIGTGKIELIDESYNANPISMEAAINVLSQSEASGRKVAILGDMGELGENEMLFHSNLAKIQSIKAIDVLYLVGPMMRCLKKELPSQKQCLWFESVDELIKEIENLVIINDTIMVKGSNYTKVSKIVEKLKDLGNDAR